MAGPRLKTVSQQLTSGNIAEFYSKSYPGTGVVCYWTIKRTIGCNCTLSGRATTSEEAFITAEEKDAAHSHES